MKTNTKQIRNENREFKIELINIKVTPTEHMKLRALANRYSKGNLSKLLRDCTFRYAQYVSREKTLTA